MTRTRVAILGATGSIGRQALEVVGEQAERFEVVALAAGRSAALLAEQAERVRPRVVCLTGEPDADGADGAALRRLRAGPWDLLRGEAELATLATLPEADVVLVATSGQVAMPATLAAAGAGKDIALANKESLVIAGELVTRTVRRTGARLFPVDSEHSALWQCLAGEQGAAVRRMVLTASGGPFRTRTAAQMRDVDVAQALAHPTWRMGPKITVDCATLMNKGLEAIETHWLFDVPYERIEVVVHPESIVHSLVEFVDGSLKAQLGWPDMKLPIQLALGGGERLPRPDPERRPFDLGAMGRLHFEPPDPLRFPCLPLAIEAGRIGGTAPAALCAADEIAVERFLAGRIRFADIARVVEHTLERHPATAVESLEQLLAVDAAARETASLACARML
ncbi:MAG TPA: 1-deoxy-D-xylulose-5-phosphate reductoisomerase [Chloroflexota bacterium]|jgi:1-deoxy-D-xylulose-5-phosphate reductoisomerase|nr:1-deoxy-D-xylulose-5-phosphate reductoisomerase [Chloroflexota bacterium]